MAQLDIQRKERGSSLVWWVLGIIVLALLAWWLLAGAADDTPDAAVGVPPVATPADPIATTPAPAGGAAETGVITDLGMLTSVTDANALTGRQVALTGVPVRQAVSDKGFWVGSGTGAGQGVFVVRTNQMASGTAPDGAADSGATVNIYGRVQAMPTDLTQQATEWNLRSTDTQALSAQKIYVLADSVTLANR